MENSAVAEHVWREGHRMDFGNMTVLAWETKFHQCCYLEPWFIQTKQTFNQELGSLPSVYKTLLCPFTDYIFHGAG